MQSARRVEIVPPDPAWSQRAEEESARFAAAVGEPGLVTIHHPKLASAYAWKRSPGSAAKRSRVARSREDGDERARRRVSEGGRVVSVGWERATRSLDRCASTCR